MDNSRSSLPLSISSVHVPLSLIRHEPAPIKSTASPDSREITAAGSAQHHGIGPAPAAAAPAPAPAALPASPDPSAPAPVPDQAAEDQSETGGPARPKLQVALMMTSLCACVFLAAIEVTIISTALPTIASSFQSATGYQWVGSAYVLGSTASAPSWGRLSDIWGRKPVLLSAICLFFAGSLICALVRAMPAFLAGRALQGIAASGLQNLVNITIAHQFSLRDRGLYFGLTSVVWALASAVGPVFGGVFTQQLSWRWCFWFNLPVSALVFVFLWLTMPKSSPGTPIRIGLAAIDWLGTLLVVGGTVMLLLGLNYGGVSFSWSSATVVNLIVFGLFAWFIFGLNEWKLARYPVIPLRLFGNRSSIACFSVCFSQGFVMMGIAYYLPLYFQAVQGDGPLLAGVYLLPFVLSSTVMAAAVGVFIQQTGKYIPTVYVGMSLMTLGTGLLIDLDLHVNWGKLVAYQILAGAGIGMNFEGPVLALQASLGAEDTTTSTTSFGFTRMLSTAVSAILGGVVFQNQMAKEASLLAVLGPDIAGKLSGGEAASNAELIKALPADQRIIAQGALNRSLQSMWIMYTAFAAAGLIAGFFIAVHPLSKEHSPANCLIRESPEDREQAENASGDVSRHATSAAT